jgi:predicted MFS family arabinose efflux permease
MGIYRGFISIGVILGPVYALTLSGIGFNVMFIGIMATSFLSFILITFTSETKVGFGNLESVKKNNMIKDYLILLKNPRLLRYYLAIMTATSGYGIINTNSAVFLGGLEGVLKPSTFLFLFGCVGMIASLVSGRRTDRRGIKSVIIPGAFLALAGFFSMAFVESFGNFALFVVIVAMGFGTNSLVISSITGIGRETRNDLKATSYSIMESAYDGGFAVGNLIFGLMVTAFGYSQGFMIVGIILTLSYLGIFTGEFIRNKKVVLNK